MTSSIKWEPIEDIKAVRDMVARSFLGKMAGSSRPRPAMDLYQTDDAFIAEIEVPGFTIDDIDVSMTSSQLTIEIERHLLIGFRFVAFLAIGTDGAHQALSHDQIER